MLERILDSAMRRVVREGNLSLHYPSGMVTAYGDGAGPAVAARIADGKTMRALILNPTLAIGEAYMDGTLNIVEGSLYDMVAIFLHNLAKYENMTFGRLARLIGHARKRFDQFNPLVRSRRNVAHHYDLDDRFYELFLDADKQYSCAYYAHEGMSLEEAQVAKKQHLIAKLHLASGQRVLDIGCGWGGMALSLVKAADVQVTGITLSAHQYKIARARVAAAGLAGRVDIRLMDYRKLDEPFDRIISVGMFEHVGIDHYPAFFAKVRTLLSPDGVAVLHSIGRAGPPMFTNPWVAKYIFPGGYIPALSEIVPVIERQNLWIGDVEILRTHYARTIRDWQARFMARRAEAVALYDERFVRMWEFYLATSEASFRVHNMMVFQVQLLGGQYAAPETRGYMLAEE